MVLIFHDNSGFHVLSPTLPGVCRHQLPALACTAAQAGDVTWALGAELRSVSVLDSEPVFYNLVVKGAAKKKMKACKARHMWLHRDPHPGGVSGRERDGGGWELGEADPKCRRAICTLWGWGWGAPGHQKLWGLILDLPDLCVLLWGEGAKVSTLGQWETDCTA